MRNASDQKSDGLEIISIGKLYTGPWEKKYWSSSRGKDRYPFPIEFSAVRMQNGITYMMEISEGLKGPLFKISSSDGMSCSGQTPGVAWESFQKKSSSQIKSGYGKRFSCKIDGLEFFGFKNAFVQRFLRELVANVGTNAASNVLPSSICMDASEVKDPTDTLPHLEKPQVRGRRSKKESVVTPASMSKTVKGFPNRTGENISDASNSKKRRQEKYNEEHPSINPIHEKDTKPSTSPRRARTKKMKSLNLKPLVEEQGLLHSAKDDLPSDAFHATDHLKVDECFLQEKRCPSSSGNLSTVKEDGNLPEQENSIDQKNVSTECQSNSLVIEDENKRTMCPKPVFLSELVAPDSLDHFSEDSCKQKHVIANDMASVKESELLQEVGIGTIISHASIDKSELDTSSHNIPNPMLSILVPQPINAFSRRKRLKKSDVKHLEASTPATITEKIETVASPEDEKNPNLNQYKKARISDKNPEDYIQITVAPDSFDGYDTGSLGYTKPHLLPKAAVDDLTLHLNKKDHEDNIQTASVAPDSFDGYDTESIRNAKPRLHPKDAVDDPTLHQKKDPEDHIQTTSVAPDSHDGYDTPSLGNTKPHLLPNYAEDDPTLHQDKKDHEDCIQNVSVAPDSYDGYDTASLGNTKPHLLPNDAENDPTLHQDKKDHEDYVQTVSVAPDSVDGYDTESLRNGKPRLLPKDAVDDPIVHQKKDYKDYIQVILVAPDSIDGYDPESLENTKLRILPEDAEDDQTLVCPDTCPNDSFGLVEDSIRYTETTASKKDTHCTRTANFSNDSSYVGKEHACGDEDLPDSDIPASHLLIQTASCSKPHLLLDDANLVCPDTCPDDAVEDSVINTETAASKTDIPCTTSLSKESLCVGKEPEHNDQDLPDVTMLKSYPPIQTVSCLNDMSKIEVKDSSTVDGNLNLKQKNVLDDLLKLVACYNHPTLISSVLMSLVGNDMYICVLSGSSEEEDRTLFVYSTPITGEKRGRPFFVGHASVNLPKSEDAFGNMIAMDSSAIQFTPDGQDLVLLNSIRVPCCWERNINCPCPACAPDCIEKNAIKIVQLNVGYVSIIIKLKTAQPVRCILVCEPYYLVALDDTGKPHMWVMNSRWSAQKDECDLPVPDNMPSQLVEIKKIPQSPGLIVGHNGFGQFCLWNIEKRKLMSRFSAPNLSIHKCVPICLFDWQVRGSSLNEHNQDEIITNILDATKVRLSGSDIQLAQPTDNKGGAVWVLLSTASHAESGDACGHQVKSSGCWRLALLAKDTVIVGDPLDISATAAGASVGHGVIGRSDGVVYMWELSTGLQIGDLHHFKGSGVSCITTDSSNSALAVASEGGQLLVYLNPRRASAKV